MRYRIVQQGASRSFPTGDAFLGGATDDGDVVLYLGAPHAADGSKKAILVELGSECLGAHTGEGYGDEGSNVLGFVRWRNGADPPSPLIELVVQPASDPAAIEAAREVFEAAGLEVVVCADQAGRILDRLLRPVYNAALRCLDEGLASAEAIDTTCRLGLGYPGRPDRARDARRPRASPRRQQGAVRGLRHARLRAGAPRRGREATRGSRAVSQPLAGITVLDFSTLLPGPLASLVLAEAGASVIKIERPGQGDEMRGYEPKLGEDSVNFALLNRGKRSLALDLKAEGARARLLPLIRKADVLIEQFRPGVMDRLGLGYAALRGGEPPPRLLLDHRLRPERPEGRRRGARPQLPRRDRHARPVGGRGRRAGAAARADRRHRGRRLSRA